MTMRGAISASPASAARSRIDDEARNTEPPKTVPEREPPTAGCAPSEVNETGSFGPATCNTWRSGMFSGFSVALDLGYMSFTRDARTRAQLDAGAFALQVRAELGLWDYVLIGGGIGGYFPKDPMPFTESVMSCETSQLGDVIRCNDDPSEAKSGIGSAFVAAEVGLQYRFRPWQTSSLTPGVVAGYLHTFGGVTRGIDGCRDCTSMKLEIDAHGYYLAPFIRLTLGASGERALIVRSQWFLTGDLQQMTYIGFEFGRP